MTHSDLPEKEKTRLNKFLNENKQVFATNLKEPDLTDKHYHIIETDDNIPAVKMSFYRQLPHLQKETDRQIIELLENQIIVPTTSSWFSPILLLKKKRWILSLRSRLQKIKQTNQTYLLSTA